MKRFWLVSREDIPFYPSPILETNCACPTDSFSLERTEVKGEIYQTADLHFARLAEHYLAFNPLGTKGVVVFNQAVYELLEKFKLPQPLSASLTAEEIEIINQLLVLELLVTENVIFQAKSKSPEVLTVWLHVTNACNLRCSYCYINKTADPMQVDTGKQSINAIFRSALAGNFRKIKIKYAGGEATLNFGLVIALHDYATDLAKENNLVLEGVVLSNGVAINARMITELKTRNLSLMVSLDGIGEFHDKQRPFVNGRGSFAYIEQTLDRLASYDLKPCISITISNQNLAGLPFLIEYLLLRELPFKLNLYRENDCVGEYEDLRYQQLELITALQNTFQKIAEYLPPYSLLEALLDLGRLDKPHAKPCGVGDSYMVINQNGGVTKCHMEMDKPLTNILHKNPLKVLIEDTQGIQNPVVTSKEGCKDCTWRFWCAGGCPALTYRVTKRFDVQSPNCNVYKAIFPEVLKLEALRLLKYNVAWSN
jgi:uncharacterized protein